MTLRYPPDFRDVRFGDYINCGWRPECSVSMASYALDAFLRDYQQLNEQVLQLMQTRDSRDADRASYAVASHFAPAYGWEFRQAVAKSLLERNALLLNGNRAALDSNADALSNFLAMRTPVPGVRQTLNSLQGALLDIYLGNASGFGESRKPANDLAQYMFVQFLA